MNVKVKLVNKEKSATADMWHISGGFSYRLLFVVMRAVHLLSDPQLASSNREYLIVFYHSASPSAS